MKVLMVHHERNGEADGAGHMAWRTADALAGRGHEVALAGTLPAAGRVPAPDAPTGGAGGVARRLGDRLPLTVAEAVARAGWVPDVVHATDLADATAAARGLTLARGTSALFALTPATDCSLWGQPATARRLCRSADVVFALTGAERRLLVSTGVAPERLAPLGQGPQLVGTADPEGFRRRVGATGPLVLFLGRKLPTKGHRHLVAATPAIRADHPDVTVVIAGPEPPGTRPPDPAPGLCHLGALDETDKHSALVAADVLCLPSVADAFPLVFVEAWWCGTPVVSGPFPGAAEVVRHGVDGLVAPATAAGVAAAVSALLSDGGRRAQMAAAGRTRARAELSWEAAAADAERGYRRAARAATTASSPRRPTPMPT